MHKLSRRQMNLENTYQRLTPFSQNLVQLCSILYEPSSASTIYQAWHATGLPVPTKSVTSGKSLAPYLEELQRAGLLNAGHQVRAAFVEIATRHALCAFPAPEVLTSGDMLSLPWLDRLPAKAECFRCFSRSKQAALQLPAGLLCKPCVEKEIARYAASLDLSDWSVEQVRQALLPDGDLMNRFVALIQFPALWNRVKQTGPDDPTGLLRLLASHLGYGDDGPLDHAIRQAALSAVKAVGKPMIPVLVEPVFQEEDTSFSNVVRALGSIDPFHASVVPLIQRAATHPKVVIRQGVAAVAHILTGQQYWTQLQALRRDEDAAIRSAAFRSTARDDTSDTDELLLVVESRFPQSHFHLMAAAALRSTRSEYFGYHSPKRDNARLLRNLRIAVYSGENDAFQRFYQSWVEHGTEDPGKGDPLISICFEPHDPEWLSSVPVSVQAQAFSRALQRNPFHLVADDEIVEAALTLSRQEPLPEGARSSLNYDLSTRYLLGGRFEEARVHMKRIDEEGFTAGRAGAIAFMEGRNSEALVLFEKELKELRRRFGKRSQYYTSIVGIFFILALLKEGGPDQLKKAEQYLTSSSAKSFLDSTLPTVFDSLLSMVYMRSHDEDKARDVLRQPLEPLSPWSLFLSSLASFYLEGSLGQDRIDLLSKLFIQARDVGQTWLAMECAELLCRVEENTPIRRNFIDKVCSETGMHSFVASLRIEEPWRRSLHALIEITSQADQAKTPVADTRLIWLVGLKQDFLRLQPLEQKRGARGNWTKGRPVALSRLASGAGLENLTPQDQILRQAVEREVYRYYSPGYTLNMEKAIPALIGHPHLFLEDSPETPIEVVKGEPEVAVTQSGSQLYIRFATPIATERNLIVKETPTRFKVLEFTEKHRRIAKILGAKGLKVPASAKEEVLTAIAGLSSHMLVHSSVGGTSKEVKEVQSNPTPHVHLLPSGPGFRFEVFVRPFGSGGPYLKPGMGAGSIITEVDGTKLQTQRDRKREKELADAVETSCPVLSRLPESERQWILDDPEDCLQALFDLKTLQDKGEAIVEWPEGEKLRVTREISFDQLNLKIRSKAHWFELSGDLQVDRDLVLDMRKLLELLQTTESRFVPLGEGQFLALTNELRKRLKDLEYYAERRGKEIRMHPLAAMALEDFTDKLTHLDADEGWKSRLLSIRNAQEINPVLPSTLKAELRDYQVEGFVWLSRLAHLGIGACLADDMGLGKTIQALSVILARATEGPTLVVAPTSVCMNWMTEASRFTPTLNPIVFGGSQREELVKNLSGHDVLVCSYGLLQLEAELLSSRTWRTIVLDEAQAIKNIMTKRSQAAMSLNGEFKLITTGTPIENHLSEFYTLFNFINPGLLGSLKRFNERFAIPIERYGNRESRKRLKKLVQPFILRRLKSQVLEELPPRTEVVLRVEMSPEEASFYEALRQRALETLEKDHSPVGQKHMKILAEITRLRQAACNPKLVLPDSPLASSKLQLFGEVVSELLESRHKALVFSQFVTHLQLIRGYLGQKGIDYRYLDGSTPPKERKQQVDDFQAGRGDLFLISLKAGGLGLNLTAADYVIHMDPWWNPAVEDQASDRAHRIGQQHPVTVYRLVTQGTIEEKIVQLHQDKRDLATSLLDGSDLSGKISAEELLQLIREV
ncbi:MAG: SNF2-related protein [Syntrophobacteraceae bacterium]